MKKSILKSLKGEQNDKTDKALQFILNYFANEVLKKDKQIMEILESCRKAIEKNWCLGCNAIEPPYNGIPNCKYSKPPTIKERIKNLKKFF